MTHSIKTNCFKNVKYRIEDKLCSTYAFGKLFDVKSGVYDNNKNNYGFIFYFYFFLNANVPKKYVPKK